MPIALFFALAATAQLRTERLPIPAETALYINLTRSASSEFVRVVASGSGTGQVHVGDQAVPPSPGVKPSEWDLSSLFRFGQPNEIRADGSAAPFWLVHGPRVFIESQEVTAEGIQVTVRNTLENTANVDIELQLEKPGSRKAAWTAERSVTVPPASSTVLMFATTVGSGEWRLRTIATKHAEAMEDEYQVEEVSGVTVRGGGATGGEGPKRN